MALLNVTNEYFKYLNLRATDRLEISATYKQTKGKKNGRMKAKNTQI